MNMFDMIQLYQNVYLFIDHVFVDHGFIPWTMNFTIKQRIKFKCNTKFFPYFLYF